LRALKRIWAQRKLAGGFKHLDYFPFHIWDVIFPLAIDELIFFRGVGIPPTRKALGSTRRLNMPPQISMAKYGSPKHVTCVRTNKTLDKPQ
jgi:hypothetical protein